jgi:hypothetical protein
MSHTIKFVYLLLNQIKIMLHVLFKDYFIFLKKSHNLFYNLKKNKLKFRRDN